MRHLAPIKIVLAASLCCAAGCVGDDAATRVNANNEAKPLDEILGDMSVSEQMLRNVKDRLFMVRQGMSNDEIIDVLALRKFDPQSNGTVSSFSSSHSYKFSDCDCQLVIVRSYGDNVQIGSSWANEIRFGCPDYPSSVEFEIPEDSNAVDKKVR